MTQKSLNVTWHDHLQHIRGLFQDLYENKKLVDVTLYCSGGSLKAHKIVLSACSPYFAKIFQECDVQHPIVILKGISYEEMHLLLEFMYKGSINILENDLDSLIQAGSYLEIKGMDVKNIPNNMKNTAKRSAEEAADEPKEIPKRIKEEREESEKPTKVIEQMQIVEEKPPETHVAIIKEPIKEPAKEQTPETPIIKTETLHRRETRFKGQKRVDVFSDNKIFKTNIKEVISSPKHIKGKFNKDIVKGQIQAEDVSVISRFQRKTSNSPVSMRKEKQEEKPGEKSVDKEKKIDKPGSNIVDMHSRTNKTKLNTTAPAILLKKSREDIKEKKVEKQKLNSSDNSDSTFEDTLSKIVIKDVYSTEEIKTSTPAKTVTKIKPKPKPEIKKVETATAADHDSEYIPVVPDVVFNESDSELNCIIDEPDDYDHYDDVDDVDNEQDEEYESGMLRVSHLECSQCNKICKSDEELVEHMKTHNNKPYKCDYCDSYFQRMSHLVRHRRTHTGEKPYSCRECGKCFSRQDKLKEHIRVHDENEYKPPPHLKKIYDPPLPYDGERRGRGRPRKNPYSYEEKPTEKRARGRPRKYSLPAPGEHVENYDITNLPFGDFSYLTSPIAGASPIPDFSDLTIIPVSYMPKPATETPSSSNVTSEKEDKPSIPEIESKTEGKEKDIEKSPEKKEFKTLRTILPKPTANEVTIINLNHQHPENDLSIINVNDNEAKVTPKTDEVQILNVNDKDFKAKVNSNTDMVEIITLKRNENETESSQVSLPDSMKHLNECTIQAVSK